MPAKKKSQPKKALSKAKKNAEQDQENGDESAKSTRKFLRIKHGIENGDILSFNDIFDIMSWTTFGRAIGIQYEAFHKKLKDPLKFTYRDTLNLAKKTGIDFDLACKFISGVVKMKEAAKEKKLPAGKGNAQN